MKPEHSGHIRHKPRLLWIALVGSALLVVLGRLVLPFWVRHYVNRQLDQMQDFEGSIGAIRINLFRGAYQILDLRMVKTNAEVPVPFVTIPRLDLSVEWSQLARGAIVAEVSVDRPAVNFVNGPSERQQQTGIDKSWQKTLDELVPLTINRFEVKDATIRFADPYRDPPVDIYITNLFATATNLTNVRNKDQRLPAGLLAHGKTTGNGELNLDLRMNPLADTPTFKLLCGVTNLDLTALNDFMRSYGNFDVQNGRFSLFVDIAAANGRYQGNSKPFFFGLNVVTWREATRQSILQTFWEAIVGTVAELFENQQHDTLATTVPISGSFQGGTDLDLWSTIGGILRNAFVQALLPKTRPPTVPLPTKNETQEPGKTPRHTVQSIPAKGAELLLRK